MKAEDIVVGLVALNDKELIGRTRLQKITYLLDRCGAEFGLPFEYYRYGPYSFELVGGLNDALAEERIEVEEKPGRHKVPYAVFRTEAEQPKTLGNLPAERVVYEKKKKKITENNINKLIIV